jgi:hypothetical protein
LNQPRIPASKTSTPSVMSSPIGNPPRCRRRIAYSGIRRPSDDLGAKSKDSV